MGRRNSLTGYKNGQIDVLAVKKLISKNLLGNWLFHYVVTSYLGKGMIVAQPNVLANHLFFALELSELFRSSAMKNYYRQSGKAKFGLTTTKNTALLAIKRQRS